MMAKFFIERPVLANVIACFMLLLGGVAIFQLPVAQYPPITPTTVQIDATFPGASAETLVETVALPIEQQVDGVENMLYMQSTSASNGQYTLTVTFDIGVDPDTAQVLVQNRVAAANAKLPSSVQDHVRAGRIPAQAAMKYLVPMCRARCEDACALAEAAARERLSARDVGELYQAWQTAGAPVRERLIAEPALFLRSRRELTRQDSPVPSPASEKLRRDLELIGVPDGPCARCGQVPQAIPIYPRLLLLRSPTSRASNALSRRPLQAMLNHSQSFCCVQAHLDLPRPSPTSPDSGSQSGGRRFDPGAVHQT